MGKRTAELWWLGVTSVVVVAAFLYFSHYRVIHGGGCDSAAYLAESLRLRGVDAGMGFEKSLPHSASLIPICMTEVRGEMRSIFPPGFSLILAGASVLGLQFYVTPFLGAVGGLALFFIVRGRAGSAIAFAGMVIWFAAPMTFWGSTQIMSDYVATAIVLLALLAIERAHPLTSGLLLGLAIGVRPTSVLSLVILVLAPSVVCRATQVGPRIFAGLALSGLFWLFFVRVSLGGFDLPYAGNLSEMHGERFLLQLRFLLEQTGEQYFPLLPFVLLGLVLVPKESAPFVSWFGLYVVIHALWRVPYDAWWQLRFLAPGLPGLFVAAAIGAHASITRLHRWAWSSRRVVRPAIVITTALVVGAYASWGALVSRASWLHIRTFDEHYELDAERLRTIIPDDALVGGVHHTITIRMYAHRQTFQWCHPDARSLIDAALRGGRPVYATFLLPDDNGCPETSQALQKAFNAEPVTTLPSGTRLIRLTRPITD